MRGVRFNMAAPPRASARRTVLVLVIGVGWASVSSPPAQAQVNIESHRRERSELGFSGTLSTDLVLRTGNVEHFRLGIRGRVDYVTARTTTFIVGRGDLGFLGDNRFNNAGLVHVRHGWAWHERVMPEAYAQVNYDEPRALDARVIVGAGARLRLAETERAGLWLGTGYMYERERLDLPDTAMHPSRTSDHRWSNYLAGRLSAGAGLFLVATGYAQPRFDDFGDIRILTDLSLNISLTRMLSLAITFSLRYDSRPPDDIVSLDTELRNGITFVF